MKKKPGGDKTRREKRVKYSDTAAEKNRNMEALFSLTDCVLACHIFQLSELNATLCACLFSHVTHLVGSVTVLLAIDSGFPCHPRHLIELSISKLILVLM